MMNNQNKIFKYGLSLNDLKFVDSKLEKQKSFLKDFVLDLGNRSFDLLGSSMGANINPKKYFAEVNNRINALSKYALSKNLTPVFLTITCPTQYHPTSNAYDPDLTVKKASLYLSDMWARFRATKIFKHMKNVSGQNPIYIRVLEPHASGVPHCHVLLYVPKNYILPLKKVFKRHFVGDGASTYAQNFKYTWHNEKGGAIAYLMKYINKTFKHALEDKMTLEAYYFAFHSLRRFTTSQTLLPVYIHRKIKWHEDFRDFLICTKFYKSGALYAQFNKNFVIFDNGDPDDPNEKVLYQKNLMIADNFKKETVRVPSKISRVEKERAPIPVIINGESFILSHGRVFKPTRSVPDRSDYDLIFLYRDFDFDKGNLDFFVNVRNELVKRNLIENIGFLPDQIYGFNDYKKLIKFV